MLILTLSRPVEKSDKIFIAGHRALVGSSLVRKLEQAGFANLLTRNRAALDLRNASDVDRFFAEEKPAVVILAAAKVGGIKADGMPRKLLDVTKIHALGWRHRIGLREGIARTYQWFLENEN